MISKAYNIGVNESYLINDLKHKVAISELYADPIRRYVPLPPVARGNEWPSSQWLEGSVKIYLPVIIITIIAINMYDFHELKPILKSNDSVNHQFSCDTTNGT